ncbi:hypothetical protein B0H21DRAFT_204754 [Amylocystis lapponica]|nr:hypothetical protein B0H21DRAFT_204754 [Amylocystis lapponica]
MSTHWRPIPEGAQASPYARCMCGKVFETGPDVDMYCSASCARTDALKTLMAGHSHYRQKRHKAAHGVEEFILPEDEPHPEHKRRVTPKHETDPAAQRKHVGTTTVKDSFSIDIVLGSARVANAALVPVLSSPASMDATITRAATPRHPELPGRSGTPTRKGPPPPLQLSDPPSVPSSMVFEDSPPPAPITEDMPHSALFSELDADQAFVFISSDVDTTGTAQDVFRAVQCLATAESPDARAHLQAQGSPNHQRP